MYDDDAATAVAMRVGVLFSGTAVSRPAGMSDSVSSVERFETDYFFQVPELAFGAANLQAVAITGDRYASRVIATVFEAL